MAKTKMNKYYKTFLKVESLDFDVSKAGNRMLICGFTDAQNRKIKHYISMNGRSKIWLIQLFQGSKRKIDFDSLQVDYFCPNLADCKEANPLAYPVGKLFQVTFVEKTNGFRNVDTIYSLEYPFINKQKCQELYEKGWTVPILK